MPSSPKLAALLKRMERWHAELEQASESGGARMDATTARQMMGDVGEAIAWIGRFQDAG